MFNYLSTNVAYKSKITIKCHSYYPRGQGEWLVSSQYWPAQCSLQSCNTLNTISVDNNQATVVLGSHEKVLLKDYRTKKEIFSNNSRSGSPTRTLAEDPDFEDDEKRSVTWQDIRDCLPTMLVLILTFTISITLIPFVFSSVLKSVSTLQYSVFSSHL